MEPHTAACNENIFSTAGTWTTATAAATTTTTAAANGRDFV
jgi:hypothetical protein